MGINAVTHALDGTEVIPSTDSDWDDWVSASSTRNHVLDDPLLDWLNRHGEAQGFKRDDQATFDERTDFLTFIFRKGAEFESAVVEHLSTQTDVHTVAGSEGGYGARRNLAVAQATFDAMHRGEPIIYQGVVRDTETRTYGSPDLLVRSDVLLELFPGSISPEAAAISARDLGDPGWHYRVVDTKFSTLGLAAGGELGNGGSAPAYKVQVFIYNRALGRLQGYEPPESFLLGRGWEQTLRGETTRVHNCMDRLGPVPQDYSSRTRAPLTVQADAAADWLRRMRREGHLWKIVPEPSIDELRVNAMGDHAPWSDAMKEILNQTEDLTVLWQVGIGKRREANRLGFTRWTAPRITPADVGTGGATQGPKLQALLDVNREVGGPAVRPAHVQAARDQWFEPAGVEFYVDFETVSSLDDDFAHIPERGGQELIFMIGCGHIEDGDWRFECFTTDALTEPDEARIIDQWFEHMQAVRDRLAPGADPKVIHWSHAEETWLETAWYAAVKRHPEKNWPHPNWFDFLTRVVRAEPMVVRGALGPKCRISAPCRSRCSGRERTRNGSAACRRAG